MTTTPTPTTRAAQAIDYRRLPWTPKLLRDYCHEFDQLESFFTGSPSDTKAWERVIKTRQAYTGPSSEISEITVSQLKSRGAPEAAVSAAKQLADPNTLTVVTGQQAGLFGGPLFTLLKAVTTVKLARQLSKDHNVAVVPVFWVHAEDHDLDEISTCNVLASDYSRHSISITHESARGLPASSIKLQPSITDALEKLRALLPETDFSSQLFSDLQQFYHPGTGIVAAFCSLLDNLLGLEGLIVFNAVDVSAKTLVRNVLDREIISAGSTSKLATEAGAALSSRGYHVQVAPDPDSASMFYMDGQRLPIRINRIDNSGKTRFEIGKRLIDINDIRTKIKSHPDTFSPNVLLRPVVQDAMFPTIAYVAGPSELAYLAQLRTVYDYFEVPMPLVVPRTNATIIDTATTKFLTRYELNFEILQQQSDGELNRLLEAQLPDEIDAALNTTEQALTEHLAAVAGSVSLIDPTLVGATETTKGRIQRDLKNLRGKVIQASKRRNETLRRQFNRARSQAFPSGELQERTIGTVYFLNRHGPSLVERLLRDLPLDVGNHWLLTL